MPKPPPARPAICLNMIVKNEAHIVHEVLDSVAPHISSWVIVDTGSDDGTQDVIREHMAKLGIPGELHERPWRNFGENRSEALTLAQGHGDYIWVIDADDLMVGKPDFTGLKADVYALRIGKTSTVYWRRQLFRDGVPWRYRGVLHEYPHCDEPFTEASLQGDYHIESRRLGARNLDPKKYERDRDVLLEEVGRHPEDARSVFYLAQSYRDLRDFANARKWYARRVELGGWDQEVFIAMYELAQAMQKLDEPWPTVQEAYLRAWEFRPSRMEPLFAIAWYCRGAQLWQRGHLFASRVAQAPCPANDLFTQTDVYTWRGTDEQAVCASQLGLHTEAFTLFRRLLAQADIPEHERQRMAKNRDFSVPTMLEVAAAYPEALAGRLAAGTDDAEVTVTLVAEHRRDTELTLNSFLNCCTDIDRVGRFLIVDAGLSRTARAKLAKLYPFVEFTHFTPAPGAGLFTQIREQVGGRFWFHLGQGWRFFAPEALITRLCAVLEAEPQVFEVGVNFTDAVEPISSCATEEASLHAPGAGRYVLADDLLVGPAMFDTARLDRTGGIDSADPDPVGALARRAAAAGLRTATLDEVLVG